MGLKFCIEPPRPNQDIHHSLRELYHSVRLHHHLQQKHQPTTTDNTTPLVDDAQDTPHTDQSNPQYIPGLYIRSKWRPPEANTRLERALASFEQKLLALHHNLPTNRRFNLSPSQRHTLSTLRKRSDLIIFPTDKNLGPYIIERKVYIQRIIKDHLSDATNYLQIPPHQVENQLLAQRTTFENIYHAYKDTLPSLAERTYFARAMETTNLDTKRVPQFYGTFKVHKKPHKSRPIVSSVNSIPELFSKWVDYWLKQIVKDLLPTYVRDSDHLIQQLRQAFPYGLPPGARLFSVDAVAMYSNIDTPHGIDVITKWTEDFKDHLPPHMPTAFVLAALSEIMKNNIFQFGDTYWRQQRGTAMGTSTAVNYAYLYVGLLEIQKLIPEFSRNLLFYRRFIDDGIGIWLNTPDDPDAWSRFFTTLNNWGTLKWTCDGHGDNLIFLDLTISISPNRQLLFKTYQKPMNLYLYIPPMSSHPQNMLRGLIFGRLRAYWIQNSAKRDFINTAALLAHRLVARGYSYKQLTPLFVDAANYLERHGAHNNPRRNPTHTTPQRKRPLIFHLNYHPRGIQRQDIRKIYHQTLAPLLPHRDLIVAVSRQRSISDRVSQTRLPNVPYNNPSNYTTP